MKPQTAIFWLLQIAVVGILVAEIRSGPVLAAAILASAVLMTLATGGRNPSESIKLETPDIGPFLGSLVAVGLAFYSLAIAFLIGGMAATHFHAPIFVNFLLFCPAFWFVLAATSMFRVFRLISRQDSLKNYSIKFEWIRVGKKRDK